MTDVDTPLLPSGAPAGERIAPGTVLDGKYRVDRVLAEGGMGYVVAATHLQLQERVAVKLLLPEAVTNREVVERFLREAQAAARLKGEHIARAIDVGTLATGAPYMVMEYLDGADLAALLAARGLLPAAEAIDVLLPVCEALAEAHARGIVHRDLKPGNVFLARRPDGSRLVKVLDFGISKALGARGPALTRSLTAMGTPAYMSPEQLRSARDVDGRTDVWSLGVVLYECVIGRRPFEADSVPGLCLAVAKGDLRPLPAWVPARIAEVIRRCLARDPARRWATMAELAAALAPLAGAAAAARTVVERTRALERGVTTLEPGRIPAVKGDPTTLGAATVVIHGARHRGVTIAGAMAIVALTAAWFALRHIDPGERSELASALEVDGTPARNMTGPDEHAGALASTPSDAAARDLDASTLATVAIDAMPTPGRAIGDTYRAASRGAAPGSAASRRGARPPGPTEPAATSAPISTVTIRLGSTPAGALVSRTVDGVALGTTPFETAWPRSGGQVRFYLTMPGHGPETIAVDLEHADAVVEREITLRPSRGRGPASADCLSRVTGAGCRSRLAAGPHWPRARPTSVAGRPLTRAIRGVSDLTVAVVIRGMPYDRPEATRAPDDEGQASVRPRTWEGHAYRRDRPRTTRPGGERCRGLARESRDRRHSASQGRDRR